MILLLREVTLLNGVRSDILIKDGRVVQIMEPGTNVMVDKVVDCQGLFVSSGWIDLHVHCFSELDPYGDEIDEIGVKQGVTTIVDAGSCGADQIDQLCKQSKESVTNVFAYINISKIGLKRVDELSELGWIQSAPLLEKVQQYEERIVGLKARMSKSVVGENGLEPLQLAQELSTQTKLPIMVHIGSGPPSIEGILNLLKKGDIVTHYLNGKPNNLFHADGAPRKEFLAALKRGVLFDVGHGSASFSFKTAKHAKQHQIPLGTISSDIYRKNRLEGPVYSLAMVMTKFLTLGYSLEEIIEAVTVKPAKLIGKEELGRIQIGEPANITLFAVENEPVSLVDSEGETILGEQKIVPKGVVMNGKYLEC